MNNEIIKSKTIKVSAQRHLVIPKEYYDTLDIGEEVTIELHEGHLVIKPVIKVEEDFAENLLEELIVAGYSGEELVAKFKEVKQMVLNGPTISSSSLTSSLCEHDPYAREPAEQMLALPNEALMTAARYKADLARGAFIPLFLMKLYDPH